MNYPVDEFVKDYRAVMASAQAADLTDLESEEALRKPFLSKYRGAILQERLLALQKVMQSIDRNRKQLTDLGYARLGLDSRINWMHRNVVRAFHRLVIEQEKSEPSPDEIQAMLEFFMSRN